MSQRALVELSRWQWALTASFHMTFPAVTVGTSVFLIVCYGAYMRTKQAVYLHMFRFWRRIFGIGFALGVVSGIVLTFEFGLNWGRFAHDVGPILGVIIGMEVVTAFFLEAGFLGLLVYGDGRVSQRVMFLSACMVCLGTILSVTWILAANSWTSSTGPSGRTSSPIPMPATSTCGLHSRRRPSMSCRRSRSGSKRQLAPADWPSPAASAGASA